MHRRPQIAQTVGLSALIKHEMNKWLSQHTSKKDDSAPTNSTSNFYSKRLNRLIMGFIILITLILALHRSFATSKEVGPAVDVEVDSSGISSLQTPSQSLLRARIPVGCTMSSGLPSNKRVIAIGDIHGAYEGLLEDLFYANITTSISSCSWRSQTTPTLVVQMGDMVDRGAGALESLECLRTLQSTASDFNAKVVRLLGNHELWWLTGLFHMKNKADTQEKIVKFLQLLWSDIREERVVATHIHYLNNFPLMFVHAGFSKDFLTHLRNNLQLSEAEHIANYTNSHLIRSLAKCTRLPCNTIDRDELYKAGPSRGGDGIGGPYWTDFDTLIEDDDHRRNSRNKTFDKPFAQVVGHTMAFCYDPRNPGVHPSDTVAECALGLVRGTSDLGAVCVDAGMYAGARAFLEISPNGHFIAHERRGPPNITPWKVTDLTAKLCSDVDTSL